MGKPRVAGPAVQTGKQEVPSILISDRSCPTSSQGRVIYGFSFRDGRKVTKHNKTEEGRDGNENHVGLMRRKSMINTANLRPRPSWSPFA